MELPHIGKHCSVKVCNKLDFLPITCDACKSIFCDEHYTYTGHNCPKAYLKNNQVPVCPLCNKPIPVGPGQQPDVIVGAHIDNDCQSDPAISRRKVFTKKCYKKGCKVQEIIKIVCNDCKLNFCLRHRHPQDHDCKGPASARDKSAQAAINRQSYNGLAMSEDEQLARALALSMQETMSRKTQEELDAQLARQLQALDTSTSGQVHQNSRSDQRCDVQ